MAGRSAILSIKILTDATDAQKGFDKAGKAAGGIGSKIKGAAVPAAAALAGLGAVAFDAAKAASEDQQAQAVLANTLKKTTGATDAQVASTEDWISKTALATGVADDQLRPALGNLARATGDTAESQKAMSTALDISAATGADVETVSKALAKAYGGNTGALKKLVPGMDKATLAGGDMSKIMDEVDKKVGGAADTAANTAAGKFQRMKVSFDEAKESAGTALLPIMAKLGDTLATVANAAASHPGLFKAIAIVIAVVAGAIIALNVALGIYETVMAVVAIVSGAAWLAALGPILLVIAAVALIIGIIVLLVKHWDTVKAVAVAVWDAIKAAALAVWEWLMGAWTAFLSFITGVWDAIKAAATAVWNAIQAVVGVVVAIITGYIRAYLAVIKFVFNAIKAAAAIVWSWIKSAFKAVVDVLTRSIQGWQRIVTAVWDRIKAAAKIVFDWIKDKFKAVVDNLKSAAETMGKVVSAPFDAIRAAVDFVIDGVESLIGWIKKIKIPKISLPFGIGGNSAAPSAAPSVAPSVAPTGLAARARAGRRATTTTAATSGGTVININGAVDPESTARQVRRILSAHDRRMGIGGAGLRAGTV